MRNNSIQDFVFIWKDLRLLLNNFLNWVSIKIILYFYIGIAIYGCIFVTFIVVGAWLEHVFGTTQTALDIKNISDPSVLAPLLQSISFGKVFVLFGIIGFVCVMIGIMGTLITYGYSILLEAYQQYSEGKKPIISRTTYLTLWALLCIFLGEKILPAGLEIILAIAALGCIAVFYYSLRTIDLSFLSARRMRSFCSYLLWSFLFFLIPLLPIFGFLFILFLGEHSFRILSSSESTMVMGYVDIISLGIIVWTILWETVMSIRVVMGYISLIQAPKDTKITPKEFLGMGIGLVKGNILRIFSLLVPYIFATLLCTYLVTNFTLISHFISIIIPPMASDESFIKQVAAFVYSVFFLGVGSMVFFSIHRILSGQHRSTPEINKQSRPC